MDNRKLQYAIIAGVAFLVLSYPATYKLTDRVASLVNVHTSNSYGCPTLTGLIAHGAVVAAIVYALLQQNIIVPMPPRIPPTMY